MWDYISFVGDALFALSIIRLCTDFPPLMEEKKLIIRWQASRKYPRLLMLFNFVNDHSTTAMIILMAIEFGCTPSETHKWALLVTFVFYAGVNFIVYFGMKFFIRYWLIQVAYLEKDDRLIGNHMIWD